MLINFRKLSIGGLLIILVCSSCLPAKAQNANTTQTPLVSLLDFNPKVTGFGFKNFRNDNHNWQDDLAADDLIRLVGVAATCKSGNNASNCVMKAAPRKWLEEYLKAIDKGRCTGLAVGSLRFNSGLGFRTKTSTQLLATAKSPFNLALDPFIENYVSYYWLTQVFDEVKKPKDATAKKGPLEIAKTLSAAIQSKKEFYTMSLKKFDKGRIFDGHEFTPFAVEDSETQYKIHVYDNNFPGETRFLFINKTGAQTWTYSTSKDQKAKPDYVGDINTQTLSITANSWRDGKCFDPPFGSDGTRATGCGTQSVTMLNAAFTGANSKQTTDEDGEDAEFFLTGEGDMLITQGGKRIGFDSKTGKYFNEVKDGNADEIIGGMGFDLPHYTLPYQAEGEPFTIVFSGKNLTQESVMDFVFSAPGFTVGFEGIMLDPDETLTAEITPDGEQISFTASTDGETPEVFFAFDSDNEDAASYITMIDGVELTAGKTLFYDFDFDNGKMFFSDDDGNEDSFDIELIRINADGTIDEYKQDDLDIGKADKYEMDFGDWDGEGSMCFKDDEDGDGFDDEDCSEQSNEETDEEAETDAN